MARPLSGLATRGGILSFLKAAMLRRYLNESLEIGHHPKKISERQMCFNVYTFFTSTLKEITA